MSEDSLRVTATGFHLRASRDALIQVFGAAAAADEAMAKLGDETKITTEALRALERPQTTRRAESPTCRACGANTPHGNCSRCQRRNQPNHKIRTR